MKKGILLSLIIVVFSMTACVSMIGGTGNSGNPGDLSNVNSGNSSDSSTQSIISTKPENKVVFLHDNTHIMRQPVKMKLK